MPIFQFEEFINEDAKDERRVSDIVTKANGNKEKEISLATTMANAIDKVSKAYERGAAASDLQHWEIANVFFDRAVVLGHPVDALIKQAQSHGGNQHVQPTLVVHDPTALDTKSIEADLKDMIDQTYNIHYDGQMRNGTQYKKRAEKIRSKYSSKEEIEYIIDYLVKKFKLDGGYVSTPTRSRFGISGDSSKHVINDFVASELSRLKGIDNAFLEKYKNLKFYTIQTYNSKNYAQTFLDECVLLSQTFKFDNNFVQKVKELYKPNPNEGQRSKGGTSQSTLYLTDPLAVIVWEEGISGQISDGYWENSKPYDHWKWIQGLYPTLGTQNKLVGTGPWKSYNFAAVNQYVFDGKAEREYALKAYALGNWEMFKMSTDYKIQSVLMKFNDLEKVDPSAVKDLTEYCTKNSIDLQLVKAFIGKTSRMKADQSLISNAIKDITKSVYWMGKY